MRTIPGITIVCPADGNETREAVKAIAALNGPVYLRIGRIAVETVTNRPGYAFELGKAALMREGSDATIVATGMMVQLALKAAEILAADGIRARVLNMHTIKPLDTASILAAAKDTGIIVTAEEHNVLCGLGGAVAEYLGQNYPIPVLRVGVEDTFGKSGTPEAQLQKYGLPCDKQDSKVKAGRAMKQ